MYAAAASLQATNVKSFNQGQVIELEIWLCQYRQLKSYLASRLSGMLDCKTNTTFYRHIDEIPMGVLRGGKIGICRLRTNILYKTWSQQLKSVDLFHAITVYLPVWHSHCTRARFTVLVSCSHERAVYSCPLLCLQRQVAKPSSELFYCSSLLSSKNMTTNLQRFVPAMGVFLHGSVERRHLGR